MPRARLMIDLHCHILPGLDDGPEDLEKAVAMARIAAKDGIRALAATPHHGDGLYLNPARRVREAVRALNGVLRERSIPLRVVPGTEVHLQPDLAALVSQGTIATMADRGRHILLELPLEIRLASIRDAVFRLALDGVTPILAHAERYRDIQEDVMRVFPLVRQGMLVQITARSLTDKDGGPARDCAVRLLKSGCVHVLASDGHSTRRRRPTLREGFLAAARILEDANAADRLVRENPSRILQGLPVDLPEPRPPWRLWPPWLRRLGASPSRRLHNQ